jgi:hypothetical protein
MRIDAASSALGPCDPADDACGSAITGTVTAFGQGDAHFRAGVGRGRRDSSEYAQEPWRTKTPL